MYQNEPVPFVNVLYGNDEVITDEAGHFSFTTVHYGWQKIMLGREQFKSEEKKIFVWHKDQDIGRITLTRSTGFAGVFRAQVVDNFDKRPIPGAIVVLNGARGVTDDAGKITLTDIVTGQKKLKISAIGYEDILQDTAVVENDEGEKQIPLTPYGHAVFTSSRDGKKSIYAIHYDGTGEQSLTSSYPGDTWGGKVTPDGSTLVFFGTIDSQLDQWGVKKAHLYAVSLLDKKSQPHRVSGSIFPDSEYVISQDSTSVVFLGHDGIKTTPEIYLAGLKNPDDFRQVTNNDTFESGIALSPNGSTVVYSSFVDGARDLFMADTTNFAVTGLTQSLDHESHPFFTPDGRSLVYVREGSDFGARIMVRDLEHTEEKEIFKTTLTINTMALSYDGTKVAFTSVRDNQNSLFSIPLTGGAENKLSDFDLDFKNIVWPKSSKVLLFVDKSSKGNELQVMDLTSRSVTRLTTVENSDIFFTER